MGKLKLETEKVKEINTSQPQLISLAKFRIPAEINEKFVANGFSELRKEGDFFVTSALGSGAPREEHIGKMRISFVEYPCPKATIAA